MVYLLRASWWPRLLVAGLLALLVATLLFMMLRPHKEIRLGAAVSLEPLLQEPHYAATLRERFESITPEIAMKFEVIHPQQNQYAFGDADAIVQFAEQNGMQVRGHTLVWHNQVPAWVRDGNFSPDQLRAILHDHIDTVVRHYRGRVVAWDVVNEPFAEDGTLRDTLWLRALGPEYIALAFGWAHAADPQALLYLNEYGTERDGPKSQALFRLVRALKARGVPIDGIGFQMHLNLSNPPLETDVAAMLQRAAQTDVRADVTEMDVETQNGSGSTGQRLTAQAEVYRRVAQACAQEPACQLFTTWGISDRHSWIPQQTGKPDAPLLFDEYYQPKPAYYAVFDTLQDFLPLRKGAKSISMQDSAARSVLTRLVIVVMYAFYSVGM